MKVEIKAKQINQVVTAETANVVNQQVQADAPPAPPELRVVAVEPPRAALPGPGSWWDQARAALPDLAEYLRQLEYLLGAPELDVGSILNKARTITERVLRLLC